jgi:hypothetical protein
MMRTRRNRSRALLAPGSVPVALAPLVFTASLLAFTASAEPMNLSNAEPRWITVRFEISPHDRPLQRNYRYTQPIPGWLEPGTLPGEVRVTISGREVERHVMAGQEPIRGSFSDFVWTFDSRSGHVRSATLSGIVVQHLNMGLKELVLNTPFRVDMDTSRPAGHGLKQRLFGLSITGFCEPGPWRICKTVRPSLYDGSTGYVNALGPVLAEAKIARIRSFSPLGEAIFSEAEPRLASEDTTPPVSLAPPAASLN